MEPEPLGVYSYTARDGAGQVVAEGEFQIEVSVNDALIPDAETQVVQSYSGTWELDRPVVFGHREGGARGSTRDDGVTTLRFEHTDIEAATYRLTGSVDDALTAFTGTWVRDPFTGESDVTSGTFTAVLTSALPRIYPGG